MLLSLVRFVALALLIRARGPFWPTLPRGCVATVLTYFGMVWLLGRFHIPI